MKHLLLLIAVLSTFTVKAQTTYGGGKNSTVEYLGGFAIDSALSPPTIDSSKPQFRKGIGPYQLAFNSINHHLMYHDQFGWVEVGSGAPGALAIGTTITGGTNNRVLIQDNSGTFNESGQLTFDGSNLTTLGLHVNGGGIAIIDGANIALGTSVGTQIGTLNTQKIGFWGTTPVIRPSSGSLLNNLALMGLQSGNTITPSSDLATTGTPSSSTFLRGDNTWATAGSSYSAGRGLNLSSTTFSLDTTPAYTWTGANTYTNTNGTAFQENGIAASTQLGIVLQNTTAATSGVVAQYPPAFYMSGTTWNNTASVTTGFRMKSTSTRQTTNVRPVLDFDYTLDGTTYTNYLRLAITGAGSQTATLTAAAINLTGNAVVSGLLTTNGGTANLGASGLTLASGLTVSMATSTPATALAGTATLVAGTATVNTTAVLASDIIVLSVNTPGGTTGVNYAAPTASIVAGTSFIINSSSAAGAVVITDVSTINWWIIHTQ